jgi:hypothetical protein
MLPATGQEAFMRSAGIYVNPQRGLAYRASTAHAAPDSADWVLLSEDTMIGLAKVRDLARERNLVPDPSALQWTGRTDAADSVIA